MFVVSQNCKSSPGWTVPIIIIYLAMMVEKAVIVIYCAMTADKCYAGLQKMSYDLRYEVALQTDTKEKSEIIHINIYCIA